MTRFVLAGVVCMGLVACSTGGDDPFSAEDELLLTAISGEEEDLARISSDLLPDGATVGRPALFRVCGVGSTHQQLWQQYDLDVDGALSEDERAALWSERSPVERVQLVRRALRFKRIRRVYDEDENAELSPAERANLEADFTARCQVKHDDLLAEFDIDDSGVLEPPERLVVRAERLENALEFRADFLDSWDADGDGHIDPDEAREIRDAIPAQIEAYRVEQLALFDANGDGVLDADERAAQRAQQREWIAAGLDLRGQ